MNVFKQLFHFLGGIYFAITLIAITALIVVVGTFLESQTNSHLVAAQWTYENPLFLLLLSLFFINILFSALRRWPFKKNHIPFLITHLGLLMIISGTILKNKLGLQGQLSVWEGSGNQHVLLPHSYALSIEKKENPLHETKNNLVFLDSFKPNIYYPFHLPHLKCQVIGYAPHVQENLETWIKGSQAYIAGFPSIPVQNWIPSQLFPEGSSHLYKMTTPAIHWSILPLRTSHVQQALQYAYLQQLTLRLKTKNDSNHILEIPLAKALQEPFAFAQGYFSATLHLSLPSLNMQDNAFLKLQWQSQNGKDEEHLTLPLQGQDALIVQSSPDAWSEAFFTVDLIRPQPSLCLVDDEQGNTFFFGFDLYGRVYREMFSSSHLQTLMSYDHGFNGYGVQAVVPFPSFPTSREDKERAYAHELTLQLQHALSQHPPLAPPLIFFEKACQRAQVDFAKTLVEFLVKWHAHAGFLFHPPHSLPPSLELVLNNLDWKDISYQDQQISQWTSQLLDQLEVSLKQGDHPLVVLKRLHWPFLSELQQTLQQPENISPLNVLAQQTASLVTYLPSLHLPSDLRVAEQAHLLSAYFRAYAIDYRSLFPSRGSDKEQFDYLETYWKIQSPKNEYTKNSVFETSMTSSIIPATAPSKLEECRPGLVVEFQQGQHKESLALAYDATGTGLKWPFLNGNYLVRFQSKLTELSYRIRLQQAREISYPGSSQVYSYESDVLISENGQPPIAKTLSMNQVHETWDGYRFYLAGIGTSSESGIKHIQLAVNHDPAKYVLTYPGAILVFIGIILLFWIYPLRKQK